VALCLAALFSTDARAEPRAQAEAYLTAGFGLRYADGSGSGLLVSGGLGARIGPVGVEYEAVWTNDHTFSALDRRAVERTTHWLTAIGLYPVHERVALGLGFGPGLGHVKPAGDAELVGGRQPAWGLREQLRIEVDVSQRDVLVVVGLRVGAEHHFQDAVTSTVEHAFTSAAYVRIGLRAW
jgi:hypothetical protein